MTTRSSNEVPRSRRFCIAVVVLAALPSTGQSRDRGADRAEPPAAARCVQQCQPRNLIFLPCMAVGAQNMAACRQREVERCRQACRRRPR